jgi:serine/threonine protein kinase
LDKLLFDVKKKLPLANKIELIRGIAAGMSHLHSHNIIHRDLAARNILLTGNGHPKISDFGMSRILQEQQEGKTQSTLGPVRWMAPESISQRTYSKQSDVWTFGIVVWEIIAQKEPHLAVNPVDIGRLIRDQNLTPKIPEDCPQKLQEIMTLCWKRDPNERPSIEHICVMLSNL